MPPPSDDQKTTRRREEARNLCWAYLYERPGLALTLDAVCNGVRASGQNFTPTELYIGLHFLVDAGYAAIRTTPTSSTERFIITAAGQLGYEAGF